MEPLTDTSYLIKLKGLGLSDAQIAKRLNMPVEQVAALWAKILAELNAKLTCGYVQLCDTFKTMALQYEQLGKSFQIVSMALSNPMSPEELEQLIYSSMNSGNRQEVVCNLLKNAIILRPFALKDPETN